MDKLSEIEEKEIQEVLNHLYTKRSNITIHKALLPTLGQRFEKEYTGKFKFFVFGSTAHCATRRKPVKI